MERARGAAAPPPACAAGAAASRVVARRSASRRNRVHVIAIGALQQHQFMAPIRAKSAKGDGEISFTIVYACDGVASAFLNGWSSLRGRWIASALRASP
jgi:hypothetical protein